jgi:hypothetical protein
MKVCKFSKIYPQIMFDLINGQSQSTKQQITYQYTSYSNRPTEVPDDTSIQKNLANYYKLARNRRCQSSIHLYLQHLN